MPTINEAAVLKFYIDIPGYSDRLTAIEAQAASSIATHKTEVAAAIAQVNLTQSQTITALTLEVNNLKTSLTTSITATQTELINKADQLRTELTDIAQQLTQDSAANTQEIQDALDYLKDGAAVASALRTPRKINGTDFDGRNDITTNAWGATRTFQIGNKTISINGTSNVDYSIADIGAFPEVGGTIQGNVEVAGNLSVDGTISANLEGTAARADKLQVAHKIQGVDFDGTQDINLPIFSTQTDGLVPKRVGATSTKYLREDGTWEVPSNTAYALLTTANAEDGTATTANTISAKVLKDAIQYHAPTVTDIAGNAGTATILQTARTFTWSGDATGSLSFNGSANVAAALTLANSGVATGTYKSVTVDAKGRVTAGNNVVTGLITSTTASGTANVATTNTNTFLNITEKTGSAVSTVGSSSQITGTGSVTVSSDAVGKITITGSQTITGNAASATKLETARSIGGVNFDGTANINLPGVDTAGNQSTSGNAASATRLQTARTINGVSFDGTQNISLPAGAPYSLPTATDSVLGGIKVGSGLAISNSVLSVGTLNQSTTGNAATASKLQAARTISLTGNVTGSTSFDGSANVSLTTSITGLGAANGIATLDSNGQVPSTQLPSYVDDVLEYTNVAAFPSIGETGKIYVETTGNTTYRWGSTAYVKITSGEVASVAGKTGVVTLTKADVGLTNIDDTADSTKSVASAAKLTTVRTINGANFDGTFNVTTPTWGTPRTLTIGSTGKSVDGSINVAWTVNEILPAGINGQVLKHNGTSWVPGVDTNTSYATLSALEANAGTSMSTRVITAAVLKGAIQTHAPVYACRAWLYVNTVTSTILQSFNIASFVKTATGQFEITFITPMPHQEYVAFTNNIAVKGAGATSNTVGSTFNATQTNTVSRCYIWCWSTSSGALVNPEVLNVGVFC